MEINRSYIERKEGISLADNSEAIKKLIMILKRYLEIF